METDKKMEETSKKEIRMAKEPREDIQKTRETTNVNFQEHG